LLGLFGIFISLPIVSQALSRSIPCLYQFEINTIIALAS